MTFKKMLIMGVISLGFLAFFGFGASASASTFDNGTLQNNFPHGGSSAEWLFLSQYQCPGHCLETPNVNVDIFYPAASVPGTVQMTVGKLCRYVGNAGAEVEVNGTSRAGGNWLANCGSFNAEDYKTWNIDNSEFSTSGAPAGYKVAHIHLHVDTNGGNQPVVGAWVSADNGNGYVVPRADADPTTNYTNSDCYTGNGGVSYSGCGAYGGPSDSSRMFALWANKNSDGVNSTDNFYVRFKPACSVTSPQDVFLRWYDADALNGSGTQTDGLSFDLYDETSNSYVFNNYGASNEDKLGGNDSYRDVKFKILPNHIYKWTWNTVSATNGIQMWMPYSGMNIKVNCNTNSGGGGGSAVAGCSRTSVSDDDGHDPAGGASITYNTNTYVTVTDSSGNTLVDRSPEGHLGNNESHTWNYTPLGQQVNVRIERWYHNTSSNNWVKYSDSTTTKTCYSATCTILDINGSGPGQIVVGGQNYNVLVQVTNNGVLPLPSSLGGAPFSITYGGPHGTGFGLDPGETDYMSFNMVAPGAVTSFNLAAYPDYYGRFALGGACNATVNVYMPFIISPHANIGSADPENPTTIPWSTGGSVSGPDVNATSFSYLGKTPSGGAEASVQGVYSFYDNYGSPTHNFSYNPPSIVAGDKYCAHVTISPGRGYRGPGGPTDIASTGDVTATSSCLTVVNEPYAHVFGSDAHAGGGFDGSSCNTAGGIQTYLESTGIKGAGSGVQFGALSLGPVNGFNSANLRGSDPIASSGLTFANNSVVAASGPGEPATGGNLGGTYCASDYYGTMPDGLTTNTSANLSIGGADGAMHYKPGGTGTGTLTINSGGIPGDKNPAVYVEGNVYITGTGIFYQTAGNFGTIEDVSSLYIIAKGGNIYIDPNVTQLDGTYVAQPKGAVGGYIFTCATSSGRLPTSQILTSCRKQLVVNGSFVAQHVYLDRSFGSLRVSQLGEYLRPGTVQNCGDSGNTSLGDCAAEIFNWSPESLLAQPSTTPSGGPTSGKYDYITSLAPVL